MLASFEGVTFLAAKVGDLTDLQLRVAYFQLDNNIDSDGRQVFPYVIYPKERGSQSFFNALVKLKENENGAPPLIEKVEFLLQSAVLQMDDELIGWMSRFNDCLAFSLGSDVTAVHHIFRTGGSRQLARGRPSQAELSYGQQKQPEGKG